jgi:DNA polymerase-1
MGRGGGGGSGAGRDTGIFASFITRLHDRGIRLDGVLVDPRIRFRTKTGRVVYRDPPLQTLPKSERLARLAPVIAGRRFIRADFGQIEPRILLQILQSRGLITWEAGDDLYLTLANAIDRDSAKVVINKLMNGGRPPAGATGRTSDFIRAVDVYRRELAADAKANGRVFTLASRMIPLDADESNHTGKAVNYVVQGTAADIFHLAALRVAHAIEAEGLPADVAFLLFDELWVETDPVAEAEATALVHREMEAAAQAVGVFVPVRMEDGPAPGVIAPDGNAGQAVADESQSAKPRAPAE